MAGPPNQVGSTWYLSFDARSIRDTGRCSLDPGGRKVPYPNPEIAVPAPRLAGVRVKCPVCGTSRAKYTKLAYFSYRTSFLGKPLGLAERSGGQPGAAAAGGTGTGSPAAAMRRRSSSDDLSKRWSDLGLGIHVTQPARDPVAPQHPAPVMYSMDGATIASIAAGKRRAEAMGTEQIDFDNSNSSSSSVETLHITHSTEFAMRFDQERATLSGGGASVGLIGFAGISGGLQQTLRSHHSVGVTSTFTVQRISEIQVPARKHVRVTLTWKRIWQNGVVNMRTTSGVKVAVPYSMTVDLGFDKKTVDVS
jgi:hypothetical protein